LDQVAVEWHSRAAVCVVLAADGYPGPIRTGIPIHGLERNGSDDRLLIFHAGTGRRSSADGTVTAGGRVLGVTGVGEDLGAARARAYAGVKTIQFEGMQYRTDIGSRTVA
jgi:phosphoribosylamine--glycine ligase